ncbi:OmpP1/FadL family transporter [Aeromonas sp. BIGb0445]|uniref:OmpP1/FadL family transporter n=1 Tax=Aeromonas sp. BIGb0445 TaxID=2940593 RepID=UPI00216A28B3|nr:outer membrane protein transport protein [Aeromonas sp. BIGb0445]MCS3458484.1 long-chain fatty acid transport protein [Aeromonas sp. BIGb0445]
MRYLPLGVTMLAAFYSGQSLAGGLYLYEIATDDVGLAGAGMAARAQDASTIFGNPAGMTRLDGDQVSGGLQGLYGDASYALDGPGKSPGNVVGFSPQGSLFYSHSINQDVKIGVGFYGNFGLGLDFGDWAGSGLVRESSLMALTLQPTVAVRLSPRLSVGGGLGINYGMFSLSRDSQTGEQDLKDHDWALNARLGLLYEWSENSRIGLAYSSRTHFNYDIETQVSKAIDPPGPLPPQMLTFNIPIDASTSSPSQLMLSGYQRLDARWALLGNIGWQNWSEFDDGSIEAAGNQVPSKHRLQDTWHLALGTQYQLSPEWLLSTGIAYDSSFYQSQSDASLTLPSDRAWRLGAGARYRLSANQSVGTALEYLNLGNAQVQGGGLSGEYQNMALYFMTVNYDYRF